MKATSYTVTISGFNYFNADLTVSVGDVVTISASPKHPLIEVSQANWDAGANTVLPSGFGTKTSNYTFTVTSTNTIYYGCQFHIGMGMKGTISVNAVGIKEQSSAIDNVSLFPNPTKSKFSLQFNASESGNAIAKLYSVSGQQIESFTVAEKYNVGLNTIHIDLQNKIPAGLYILTLNYNSKTVIRKVIVE